MRLAEICSVSYALKRPYGDLRGSALRAIVWCPESSTTFPFISANGRLFLEAFSPVDLIFFSCRHERYPSDCQVIISMLASDRIV